MRAIVSAVEFLEVPRDDRRTASEVQGINVDALRRTSDVLFLKAWYLFRM